MEIISMKQRLGVFRQASTISLPITKPLLLGGGWEGAII